MKYYRIALEIVLIYFTLVLFTKFYLDLEVINLQLFIKIASVL